MMILLKQHTENDRQRIACFERTGCLITQIPCNKDLHIKPQGVTIPFLVPTLPPPNNEVEEVPHEPEAQSDTQEMLDIIRNFNNVELEDEEVLLHDENLPKEANIYEELLPSNKNIPKEANI